MTERLSFHFSFSCIGEGNGNPLQCSCLENPRGGGAWWASLWGRTIGHDWSDLAAAAAWFLYLFHSVYLFCSLIDRLLFTMLSTKEMPRTWHCAPDIVKPCLLHFNYLSSFEPFSKTLFLIHSKIFFSLQGSHTGCYFILDSLLQSLKN